MAGTELTMVGDRYELLRKLGAGGMAEVWLAADHRLDNKYVAVKRLHGFRAAGAESVVDVERARREAFAVSRLTHPNLVAVTDFIAERGEPFIVMEYVEGKTLEDLSAPDGLPPGPAARILAQVAEALAEAHAARIVHRDIKPANIMVTSRGDAKLADFGIARAVDDPRLTKTGMFTGSIRYLAPEILDGQAATPASDVWSLGATMFEVVEGRPAFDGPTTAALMMAIAMAPLPMPTQAGALAPIIARLLDRDPHARPAAAEVARLLREVPATATTTTTTTPTATAARRHGVAPKAPAGGVPIDAPTVVGANFARPDARPDTRPDTRPDGRARPRPKRRNRAWMIVAVPAVLAGGAIAVTLSGTSGDNHPTADGPQHSVGAAASSPVHPSRSAIQVGGGAPAPNTTRSYRGVTIVNATDRERAPTIRSKATTDPTSLELHDLITGHGGAAPSTGNVTVQYVIALYRTGAVIDSTWTSGGPKSVDPADVPGLTSGLEGTGRLGPMRVGGRRIVIVPNAPARAIKDQSAIPTRATLVYVIDLIKVPTA